VLREPGHRTASLLVVLTVVVLTGCDSGSAGPLKEPGPVPLSSRNAPITRMVETRSTLESTWKEVFWDEGNGPVAVAERAKLLVDAVPKEVLDQVNSTRNVPAADGKGILRLQIYATWGAVVSVRPDVMIVSIRKNQQGSYAYSFEEWSTTLNVARRRYIDHRLEDFNYIVPNSVIHISAGTLVPWSEQMYVVSTDPKVPCGRLKFKNDRATVMLPDGILVFRRHEDDVDVSGE
jgi:hypothetical protein